MPKYINKVGLTGIKEQAWNSLRVPFAVLFGESGHKHGEGEDGDGDHDPQEHTINKIAHSGFLGLCTLDRQVGSRVEHWDALLDILEPTKEEVRGVGAYKAHKRSKHDKTPTKGPGDLHFLEKHFKSQTSAHCHGDSDRVG